MKQKNIFLKSEADAWFARNKENLSRRNFEDDNIVRAISDISKSSSNTMLKILEIGCGGGERLNYISNSINCSVSGVDPSLDAVNHCKLNNIDAIVGTADSLTHKDNAFDIVIFGFCLYLCDRGDLFRISTEADRVLKKEGWIIIQDFLQSLQYRMNIIILLVLSLIKWIIRHFLHGIQITHATKLKSIIMKVKFLLILHMSGWRLQ